MAPILESATTSPTLVSSRLGAPLRMRMTILRKLYSQPAVKDHWLLGCIDLPCIILHVEIASLAPTLSSLSSLLLHARLL